VLDTVTDAVTATVNLPDGGLTENLTLSPDGSVAYVGNFYGSVDVFNTATDAFGTVITLPDDLSSLTLNPDGSQLYAATYGGIVSVIDAVNDTAPTTDTWNLAAVEILSAGLVAR
jgi:DNA-binding beta-propeller fold protein YncE